MSRLPLKPPADLSTVPSSFGHTPPYVPRHSTIPTTLSTQTSHALPPRPVDPLGAPQHEGQKINEPKIHDRSSNLDAGSFCDTHRNAESRDLRHRSATPVHDEIQPRYSSARSYAPDKDGESSRSATEYRNVPAITSYHQAYPQSPKGDTFLPGRTFCSMQAAAFSTSSRASAAPAYAVPDDIAGEDTPGPSQQSRGQKRGHSQDRDVWFEGSEQIRFGSRKNQGGRRSPARPPPQKGKGQFPQRPFVMNIRPPVHDEEYLIQHAGPNVKIKEAWKTQAKSYLGNALGVSVPKPTFQDVLINAEPRIRATLTVDGITGIGDGANPKEAENLAALHALLQVEQQKAAEDKDNSNLTSQLSDGSILTYDRAKQFMDYYCRRFHFPKPLVEFSTTSVKIAKKKGRTQENWEAVISVDGRKIGLGKARLKKDAQIRAYLDVVRYLESSDESLWRDFAQAMPTVDSPDGLAPNLVFQMSGPLSDDVKDLCDDIRHSTLYRSAPSANVANADAAPPAMNTGRVHHLDAEGHQRKSREMRQRQAAYQNNDSLRQMRDQRQSLPVMSRAAEVLKQIEENDVTVLMASTGSGKTTQIPQIILDHWISKGKGSECNVLCTQPRRLAATSVAERIADERGQKLGGEVGYQVRFDHRFPEPNGSITFCTTGIFLKRMQSSLGVTSAPDAVRAMDQITHIIVDEVHERDIDTDLSLVVLKRFLADRKARGLPLKIILMSATIDPTLFQNYFKTDDGALAPVVEIPGRTFPVQRHWLNETYDELRRIQSAGWVLDDKHVAEYIRRELSPDTSEFGPDTGMDRDVPHSLIALYVAHVLKKSEEGHVLVFLPGWEDIKKVANVLLDARPLIPGISVRDELKYNIHYLHSNIPAAEQREVFTPPPAGVRRIILATNIAETSVTIPDVVYVVDTGRVKEIRYDPDRHMSSLVSAWVGSSNLNQRAGRAGRHREGEYYALISHNRRDSLNTHQMVEMMRADLSNVVMHVKALNIGETDTVLASTIEPPEPWRVVSAMQNLNMLGALDERGDLTSLGRVLLQLPVEAAIGKLCLYGSFFRCLDSALTLAAVLTNRDPFLAPVDSRELAQDVKDAWSPLAFRSDALASVAAFNKWNEMEENGAYARAGRFCHENFLSKSTLLQMKQVKKALLLALGQAGVLDISAGTKVHVRGDRGRDLPAIPPKLNENNGSLPILAALIAMASAPNFAVRLQERVLRTAQDKVVTIQSGSVNSKKREKGGPTAPSASYNTAERRLYAFQEKVRSAPTASAIPQTMIRGVTRLDPLIYMLFGAHRLVTQGSSLHSDSWLPITGNRRALEDIKQLKELFEQCMLRVFEGVNKSLVMGRDQRWRRSRDSVQVAHSGSSRIRQSVENDGSENEDEGENENDDDEEEEGAVARRVVQPLNKDEIREIELLTTDIVRVLDAYAADRQG